VTLDTELEAQERSPWQQTLQPKYITKLIMIVIIGISTGDFKGKTRKPGLLENDLKAGQQGILMLEQTLGTGA
jgi:hypothetical protein